MVGLSKKDALNNYLVKGWNASATLLCKRKLRGGVCIKRTSRKIWVSWRWLQLESHSSIPPSSQLPGKIPEPRFWALSKHNKPPPLSLSLLLLSSLFLLPCDKLGPSESSCSPSCLLLDSIGVCIFNAIHPCRFFFFFCHKSISLDLLTSQYYLLWSFFWIHLRKASVCWKVRIHLMCVRLPFSTQDSYSRFSVFFLRKFTPFLRFHVQ